MQLNDFQQIFNVTPKVKIYQGRVSFSNQIDADVFVEEIMRASLFCRYQIEYDEELKSDYVDIYFVTKPNVGIEEIRLSDEEKFLTDQLLLDCGEDYWVKIVEQSVLEWTSGNFQLENLKEKDLPKLTLYRLEKIIEILEQK